MLQQKVERFKGRDRKTEKVKEKKELNKIECKKVSVREARGERGRDTHTEDEGEYKR